MLQELAKRVGPIGQWLVEREAAVAHQRQRRRGDHGLGEAPPRYVCRIAVAGDDGALANEDMRDHATEFRKWQAAR